MTRTLTALALAVAVLAPRPATPQAPAPEEAKKAAQTLVKAMAASDWDAMADAMHPRALTELRDLLQPVFGMADMEAFRQQLLGVTTVEEMRALPDHAFFVGLMRLAMTQDPTVAMLLKTARYTPVGVVMEGDTAHVVGRIAMEAEGIPISQMDVSSFLPHQGRWMGLLTGDVSAMAAVLATMAEQAGADG